MDNTGDVKDQTEAADVSSRHHKEVEMKIAIVSAMLIATMVPAYAQNCQGGMTGLTELASDLGVKPSAKPGIGFAIKDCKGTEYDGILIMRRLVAEMKKTNELINRRSAK